MENELAEKVPLLQLVTFLMAGIVVGEYVPVWLPMLAVFIGVVVLTLLLWKFRLWQSLALCVCFLVLGALLVERQRVSQGVAWPEGEVCYEAVVMSEPVEKPKTMAVDILLPASHRQLKCYLYKDGHSRSLRVGDGLRIQSRIRENSFWRQGSTFVSSWEWQKAQVSLSNLSYLERTRIFFLRQRGHLLRRISNQGLDGGEYAVVAAMVLGDKSALTKDLKEVYSVTGASHVLALSGLHLGIIYTLLSLLVVGRRWRVLSQMLMILVIWAFVFLVGLSVSVVRSAVMLTTYALLSLGHREKMSMNTLAFAAMILLLVNPLSLFDVGFQMSFAAVASILLFVPLFENRLWSLVTVSCAAQIGVAPLIAYYFGRFSTYFLLTNLVVVPAATVILWLALVVLLFPSLAYLLLYVVGLLNTILTMIASLPGASISLHPTILQTVMVYVVIIACYLLIRIAVSAKGWSPSTKGS
jgi:competence protein ComEC